MTLQQIINHVPEYKIIETGEIFEISKINYDYKTVKIFDKWLFWDQVQKLTPLSFNGERIGIGDTIITKCERKMVIYGYHHRVESGEWLVEAHSSETNESCIFITQIYIKSHTPLHPSKAKEITIQEIERKFGCKVKIIK